MASFISVLSLFVFILSNGCFTLPIDNEQLSSSTSLNDNSSNEQTLSLRWSSNNETSGYPYINKHDSSEEHVGFESISTTNQPDNDKRFYDYFLSSSSEPTTDITGLKRDIVDHESENGTETDAGKREIQVEFLTNDTVSSTSTVVSHLFASGSSTEKYTGHLKYEKVNQDEQEQPTKPIKPLKKPIQSESESEEDSHGSTAPTAVFDQDASDNKFNVNNYAMVLDENNTLVVTDFTKKFSTTTWENSKEPKPLNQGKESLHTEKKE